MIEPFKCEACEDTGLICYDQLADQNVYRGVYRTGEGKHGYAAACLCQKGLRRAKPYGAFARIDQVFPLDVVERDFFPNGLPKAVAVELSNEELAVVGLPAKMRRWTFLSYPDQRADVFLRAHGWVASPAHRMLVFHGRTGTGKTGLAVAMLRGLLEQGRSVKFVAVNEFLPQLQATFNNRGENGQTELDVLLPAFAPYLLVLDDLNARRADRETGRMSAYMADITQLIINKREGMEKPTIFTTNMSPDDLQDYLPATLYDRLQEGEFWEFLGTSKRKPRVLPFGRSATRKKK